MSRSAREAWGRAADGTPIERLTLERDGLRASFTNFGAALIGLEVPDRDGACADVVLGFDTLAEYASAANPYFGGIVGRCANRIAGARFELDGREFALAANAGHHHLHGGLRGFDRRAWAVRLDAEAGQIEFTLHSSAGDEGYPGALDVRATYRLLAGRELELRYVARCDAPTLVNLTQHSYFNLAGGGSVAEHLLEVAAARRVVVDDELIPTGELAAVQGSVFDLRTPRRLAECLAALDSTPAGGLDDCFVLEGERGDEARFTCRLSDPQSGRVLEVFTTQPGLQVYSGNRLADLPGKRGARYLRHGGLCLEAQHFPDSVHRPSFPSVVLRPGEVYRHVTRWRLVGCNG